jgi:predicted secreted protein
MRDNLIKVAPSKIKESLGVRGVVEDLRRDVWQITPSEDDEVLGKPGDVLAIEVSEIPSSGYSWTVQVPAGLGLLDDFYGPASQLYGDTGRRRFLIEIESSGDRVLRLEHGRRWESERLDTRTVQVHALPAPKIGLVEPAQAVLAGI